MRYHRALTSSASLLTALTLTLGLGLAACGTEDTEAGGAAPSASQTAANGDVFNGADVAFATDMIPHHAQAIEMVTLTDGRSLDPAVRQLAEQIRAAQAPEVETMVDWLTAWGQEVPETSIDHTNAGHGSGESTSEDAGEDMPGMMSAEEMDDLAAAPDAEFQTTWLEMMKGHHEGAIAMATTEQDKGSFSPALDLAGSIITTQQAEIEQIDELLR